MRKAIVALAVLLSAPAALAQYARFSIGAEGAVPVGDLALGMGPGVGGTLGVELPLGDYTGLIAQGGFINFFGKEFTVSVLVGSSLSSTSVKTDPVGFMPVQVGLKYYFVKNQHGPYASFLTGVHMSLVDVPTFNPIGEPDGTKKELHTNFSAGVPIGWMVGKNWDIAARYQMIFAEQETVSFDATTLAVTTKTEAVINSYVGLRVAYVFGMP